MCLCEKHCKNKESILFLHYCNKVTTNMAAKIIRHVFNKRSNLYLFAICSSAPKHDDCKCKNTVILERWKLFLISPHLHGIYMTQYFFIIKCMCFTFVVKIGIILMLISMLQVCNLSSVIFYRAQINVVLNENIDLYFSTETRIWPPKRVFILTQNHYITILI